MCLSTPLTLSPCASFSVLSVLSLSQMIDSMAEAIKQFNGGVVVISHDFR